MKDPAVKRVQERLIELGYNLGKLGPDSVFGDDTDKAVRKFQEDQGLSVDGIVGPDTLAAMEGEDDSLPKVDYVVDTRNKHGHPRLYAPHYSPRSWAKINSVVLHQVGVTISDCPSRWDSLNAHIGLQRNGLIVFVNDPTDFIWHAQHGSKRSIGIEINGFFPGTYDDFSEVPAERRLTKAQIQAAPRLFDLLQMLFRVNDAIWEFVYLHRQFKDTRRGDPGKEIYETFALPWMEKLGVTDGGPDFKSGSGKPVPKDWNPNYTARY